MADEKLADLPEETDPQATDLVYVVRDPDGTPEDVKVQIGNLPGGGGLFAEDGDFLGEADVEASPSHAMAYLLAANGVASNDTAGFHADVDSDTVRARMHVAGTSVVEVDGDTVGGPARLGFFAATPVERPQLDSSTATAEDIVQALAALGLVEDTA